jgi:hypothetical protein
MWLLTFESPPRPPHSHATLHDQQPSIVVVVQWVLWPPPVLSPTGSVSILGVGMTWVCSTSSCRASECDTSEGSGETSVHI